MTNNREIIQAALNARTAEQASGVQAMIESAVGARHARPVGDRWNNQGMLTASGASYDHKILEVVTNMQDAVLERLARMRFGAMDAVPYATPHEAAVSLMSGMDDRARSQLASVTLEKCSSGAGKRQITVVLRDRGCGITAEEVPMTIFQIGASHKDGVAWQQGKFGLGGATTYRNAKAIVLVTRRDPALLASGEEDRIALAVVQWERRQTTTNAFYLVAGPWHRIGDEAQPFSVPAHEFPEFESGVHLALVGYDTQGLARHSGDERSFDTVFNTRIFRPVIPIAYRNLLVREREETLRGLERRLNDNPPEGGMEGRDVLPFKIEAKTYHLPVRFRLFAKPGQPGQRRNFVAYGHALLITSNGQVHAHWSPQDFKLRTKLNKLADRILVAVESDELPIELRTELFTADRTELVRTSVAIRLESEIAGFLDDWGALQDANAALIREAITGDNNDRPTIEIARKIARAFRAKGFSTGGAGSKGGGTKAPPPTPKEDLYLDPTHFEGPEEVQAVVGRTKGIYFRLNAVDNFLGDAGRAELVVTCDHPEIDEADITVGELHAGRVRVSVAVPDSEELGTYELRAVIPPWPKSSGGLGPRFEWTTKLELVRDISPKPPGPGAGPKTGRKGPGQGDLVALVWRSDENEEGWDPTTVGEILMVPGKDLAAERAEYEELRGVSDEIPTIVLNRTYSPLKSYVQARAAELTDEGKEQARDRFAVGVGVALLVLDAQRRKDAKANKPTDDDAERVATQAAARAVLSVLPEYDRLAREIED
jgi:hypothetical protein